MKIIIQLHKAIQREYNTPEVITKETTAQPLIKAIQQTLQQYPKLENDEF